MSEVKIMILSTKTGQGHNSTAGALKSALERQRCRADIFDILNSGKKPVSDRVSSLYNSITLRTPAFLGCLYYAGEFVSSNRHHSPIYYLNTLYAARLKKKIEDYSPQAIVCPHIFSAQAVTRLKEKYGLQIPTMGIVTDYTCSPFWEETRLDAYIIAAPQLIPEFIRKGIPREKLYPIGIPVMESFRQKQNQKKAREAFGITAQKVFVLMGGSMGYGDMPVLAEALLRRLPDAQIVAACGRNQRLFNKLQNKKNILPLSYINNTDLLMDCADVLLTKPGGLSSTEAMAKRIPIVFTRPIPGGEVRNANFFQSIGVAICEKKPNQAALAACELLLDEEKKKRMLAAQELYCNKYADEDTASLLLKLITAIPQKIAKKDPDKIAGDKAEDAAWLVPGKDDNVVSSYFRR